MGLGATIICSIYEIIKIFCEDFRETLKIGENGKFCLDIHGNHKEFDKVLDLILDLRLSKSLSLSNDIYKSIRLKYPEATDIKIVYGLKNPLKTKIISLESYGKFETEFQKTIVTQWGKLKNIDLILKEGE